MYLSAISTNESKVFIHLHLKAAFFLQVKKYKQLNSCIIDTYKDGEHDFLIAPWWLPAV